MINIFDNIISQHGRLLFVDNEEMIKRYNAAMEIITGKTTSLTSFHIDATGFSPEIAEELNNQDYLDAYGANKKFILITTKQMEMDVVSTHFSSTIHVVKSFYRENAKELGVLTTTDVVFGELDNKRFKINRVSDLIKTTEIEIKPETSRGLIKQSQDCLQKVQEIIESNSDWENDDKLNEIISLSNGCGNVIKNQPIPTSLHFTQRDFRTSLFGGLYVLQGKRTVIIAEDPLFNDDAVDAKILHVHDEKTVLKSLIKLGLIQPSIDKLKNNPELLRKKLEHIVLDSYLNSSFNSIKDYITHNYDSLPSEFHTLEELIYLLNDDDYEEKINPCAKSKYRRYIYEPVDTLPPETYALVSRLMCHYKKYSYLSNFIYHPELFEKMYNSWSSKKQQYIKQYLLDSEDVLKALRARVKLD